MDADGAFIRALEAASASSRVRKPRWLSRTLTHSVVGSGDRCVYCGCEIGAAKSGKARWAMDHLVPVSAGGPTSGYDCQVPACASCVGAKGARDWLLFGKAMEPERIQSLRLQTLSHSLNHLAPDPSKAWTKLQVGRLLAARWRYPRTPFFAAVTNSGAYLGLHPGALTGAETAAVLALLPKVSESVSPGYRIWKMPAARFLEVVWQLIELNAYVRRLDLGSDFPDATPQDDPDLARWAETHWNPGEIVLRRDYQTRDEWHPNRRYPRREPGAPEYRKPVKNPRPPKPKMTAEEIKAKVDAMMQDSHPIPIRMLGPRARALEEQRDNYDRLLLDLGFRMLAYSVMGEELPWDEPCRYRYIGKDGELLSKPSKRRKPVKRLTPRQRRERRAAALAAGLPPPKRAWP